MSKKNIIEILKKADHYSVEYNDIEAKVNGEFVKKIKKRFEYVTNCFCIYLRCYKENN